MAYENEAAMGPYSAPPMSIKEIADKAVDFDYDPLIPLRYWLRTADTLLKEATIYQAEGNEQQAYLLLVRQAELVFRHLPNHPESKKQENLRNLRVVRARSNEALKRLEYMKPRITARYESYKLARQRARDDDYRELRASNPDLPSGHSSRASSTISHSSAAALPVSQKQTRKGSIPKPLDLSRGSRRGSASSVTGPFSPPLERSLSSSGLGQSVAGSQELAMEIAKQEFEKREREKRARRRQIANEQGRGNIIVDSRGQEIKRISTPATAAVEQSYRNLLSQYQPESRGRDSGYVSVNEHPGYAGYYQGTPEDRERHMGRQALKEEEEHRRRVMEQQEEEWDLAKSIEALHMKAGLSERQLQASSVRNSYRFSSSTISGWEQQYEEPARERESYVGRWQGNYPTVPKRSSPTKLEPPPIPGLAADFVEVRSVTPTPTPPPKAPLHGHAGSSKSAAPAIPYKKPLPYTNNHAPSSPPPLPNFPSSSTLATPAATKHIPTTPEGFQFSTPATLENGTPLRTIFLPASLRQQFLLMAAPNTNRNLETCGILCGTLIQNALFVSRLVIPEQEATSDTCTTKDEEGLFEYVDKEDLIVLGWIHTHPTQTCFMSSVDLHTHCSYQLMLAESIAIVCSPRHEPSWGVFRLTDPPGVKTIMGCRQQGLFHPHGEANVYTDAMRPGHVCEVREMGFDVVDLRKGK